MKETTIYDIAMAVGVSPSTVSRALKGNPVIKPETTGKIIAAARSMGYRHNKFASSLRKRNSCTIGVIIPRLNSYFMAAAIAGIEKVCGECNYTIIITQSQESTEREAECIETLFSGRVDGLLVSLAAGNGRTDHFGILHRAGIPVVFFDRTTDMRGSSAVVIDNEAAAYQMTSHLVSEGCRKFYFLGGSMKSPVYRERYSGFRRALTENGLPFSDDYYTETELTPHAGESGAMRIVSMRVKPDALFCSNDTSAAYAILTLMSEGVSIPSDIAVAGFNNDPISRVVRPELTTVSYPAYEVGTRAANLLIEKISGGKTKQSSRVVLDHEIIIRNSSKRR